MPNLRKGRGTWSSWQTALTAQILIQLCVSNIINKTTLTQICLQFDKRVREIFFALFIFLDTYIYLWLLNWINYKEFMYKNKHKYIHKEKRYANLGSGSSPEIKVRILLSKYIRLLSNGYKQRVSLKYIITVTIG